MSINNLTTYNNYISEIKEAYANMLILQYRTKPKARATVQTGVDIYSGDGLIYQLQDCLNINTAKGAQLDLIGKILGVSRTVPSLPSKPTFFCFEYTETTENYTDAQTVTPYIVTNIYNFRKVDHAFLRLNINGDIVNLDNIQWHVLQIQDVADALNTQLEASGASVVNLNGVLYFNAAHESAAQTSIKLLPYDDMPPYQPEILESPPTITTPNIMNNLVALKQVKDGAINLTYNNGQENIKINLTGINLTTTNSIEDIGKIINIALGAEYMNYIDVYGDNTTNQLIFEGLDSGAQYTLNYSPDDVPPSGTNLGTDSLLNLENSYQKPGTDYSEALYGVDIYGSRYLNGENQTLVPSKLSTIVSDEGRGFSTKNVLNPYPFKTFRNSTLSVYSLNDDNYRILLKFATFLRRWRGSWGEMDEDLYSIFGDDVDLINNKDGSITLVMDKNITDAGKAALTEGYLQPPCGIGLDFILVNTPPRFIFGFRTGSGVTNIRGFSTKEAPNRGLFLTKANIFLNSSLNNTILQQQV